MLSNTVSVRDQFFLDSFCRSLRARNCSDKTVDTYSESVRQFASFLIESGMPTQVENITREHVESFIEELLRKWKPATANNRYRGLQSYFNWLVEEGEIKASPMLRMKPPMIPPASAKPACTVMGPPPLDSARPNARPRRSTLCQFVVPPPSWTAAQGRGSRRTSVRSTDRSGSPSVGGCPRSVDKLCHPPTPGWGVPA